MQTLIRRRGTAASDLSLHFLLSPVCPSTRGKYGGHSIFKLQKDVGKLRIMWRWGHVNFFLPFSTRQMLLFPEAVSQFAPISVSIGDLTGLLMVE